MMGWDSAVLRAPILPWTPLHIKQEPIDNAMVNTFIPNHSEGFHSSSPSSSTSSRGSPPASSSPSFIPLTPPGFETSPENQSRGSQHQMSSAVTPPSPPWASTSDGVPSPGPDSLPDGEDEPGVRIPAVNSHGKVKTFKCKQCEFVAVTKLDFWDHTKSHIKPERMLTCPKCPFVTEYKHHLEYHMRNHYGSKPFNCPQCTYSCVNKSMLNSHLKSHSNIYQYRCRDCNYATKYCHSLKLHLRKYGHQPAMVLNEDGTPNPLPIIDVYGTRRGPKQKSRNKEEVLNNNNNNIPQSHTLFQNPFGINFPYGSILHHPMLFPNNNNVSESSFQNSEGHKEDELAARAMQNLSPHLQAMHQRFFSEMSQNAPNFSLPIGLPQISPDAHSPRSSPFSRERLVFSSPHIDPSNETPGDALDLTSSSKHGTSIAAPSTPSTSLKSRRKGRAFKLDKSVPRIEQADDSMEMDEMPDFSTLMNKSESEKVEVKVDVTDDTYESIKEKYESERKAKMPKLSPVKENASEVEEKPVESAKKKDSFACQFCDIIFKDIVMYTMHMGYHGFKDPFTCNMCGEKTDDKVSFFVHIARSQHS